MESARGFLFFSFIERARAASESTGDLWRRVTKQLAEVTPSPGDVNRGLRLTTNWEGGQARRQCSVPSLVVLD